MSCLFCERVSASTFYSLNETCTLHSKTPVKQFFENIVNMSIEVKEPEQLFCGSCYDNLNEVDQMKMKIKEISDDLRKRFRKRININEELILSSMDRTQIYSITVDDSPDFIDYNDDTEICSKSTCESTSNGDITGNNDYQKKLGFKHEKIHFSDENDLKNILSSKIKSDEDSEHWESKESLDIGILYDMMDEKNVEVFLQPVSNSPSKKSRTTCTKCDISFSSKEELKSHNAIHAKDKPYICEVCGKVYRHKSALNIHVGMHNGIVPFKCLHCDKTFTQKGAMIRHNKIHTGEKPYQCEECGKCFTHHTSFTIHKISHTGEKSYKCNVCGLMLMSTSHLKRHMRVHTGEKSYSCATCGKRFAEKYNLVTHSKVHMNDAKIHRRKFRCEFCNLEFYKRLHLEEHITKSHSSEDNNYDYS